MNSKVVYICQKYKRVYVWSKRMFGVVGLVVVVFIILCYAEDILKIVFQV